jgi:Cytosine deaminase and related metal-dependent hydrolases
MTTTYRAEWLLPITAPPVRNGAVAVEGDRIVAAGTFDDVRAACPDAATVDFDQAVLMPGFVNAHSHLEYTSFRGMFDDEQFGDWIISLIDVKASLHPTSTCGAPASARSRRWPRGSRPSPTPPTPARPSRPPPQPVCAAWPISRSSASTTSA